MKFSTLLLILSLFSLVACNKQKKSEEIASYSYSADVKLAPKLYNRVGTWIEEGIDCYGIIIMYTEDGEVVSAKPVKAKTLVITEKAIKMKALETVTLAPKHGCSKLGLDKDDTWWENEGDLFRTKEEAEAYIKSLPKMSSKKSDKGFSID